MKIRGTWLEFAVTLVALWLILLYLVWPHLLAVTLLLYAAGAFVIFLAAILYILLAPRPHVPEPGAPTADSRKEAEPCKRLLS